MKQLLMAAALVASSARLVIRQILRGVWEHHRSTPTMTKIPLESGHIRTYLDWIISSSQSSMDLVHQSSKSWGRKHQPLALGGSSELLGNIGADETTHPSH